MLEKFRAIADEMFTANDKMLLAVSGGVDSMVMLDLFCKTNLQIAVAHCNFSLRGEESDGDTQLVMDFCKQRDITLHTIKFNTHAEMASSGDSMQMTARKLRYDWFTKIANEHKYTKIAIAHNSGDTIETFFINILRGTGVRGLIGIPTLREKIVRPIMGFSREQIETYAVANSVMWRDDSSNSGTKYLRNKLRHIVLPELRKIEPDFDSVMLLNMAKVTHAVSFMDNMIQEIRSKALSTHRGRVTIALSVVAQYKPFEFVLYELLSPYGFNATQVAEMAEDVNSTKKFECADYDALLSRGLLLITEKKDSCTHNEIIINSLDTTDGLHFEILDISKVESFKTSPNIAFFDADKVQFPLTVRSWREGDYFIPFGMDGRKKLSDFFVDNKVNILDKDMAKILADASGDIIWIVGQRSDNRYRVGKDCVKVLKISYSGE